MSANKDWEEKRVPIGELSLDLENPRLPDYVLANCKDDEESYNKIRQYMLEQESIMDIAESIANNGYHKSKLTIACYENDKLVALDGNRRLAICQLLSNPLLANEKNTVNRLKKLQQQSDLDDINSVRVTIAPTRDAADSEILANRMNTASLRPWENIQRFRKLRSILNSNSHATINDIAKKLNITATRITRDLTILFFYEKTLDILDDNQKEEFIQSGVNKLTRLMVSAAGKKLYKYNISGKGEIFFEDEEYAIDKLKKSIPYILGEDAIPAQVKIEYLLREVYPKIFPKEFTSQQSIGGRKPIGIELQDQIKESRWVSYKDIKTCMEGNYPSGRVIMFLQEMQKKEPINDENVNILSVSIRVVLELSLYEFLKNHGKIKEMKNKMVKERQIQDPRYVPPDQWTPSFAIMFQFVFGGNSEFYKSFDPQQQKAIDIFMKDHKDVMESMNNYIHNPWLHPDKDKIIQIWQSFGRTVLSMLASIDSKN